MEHRMITNTAELIERFQERAHSVGLTVQCPADGLFHSEIAIVAEAPGPREVIARSPMVGGAGSKLWFTLRTFHYNRNDFYITNVSKRQIAVDDDDTLRNPLLKLEKEHWMDLLRWELSCLPNLKYVIVLGNLALEALTGHEGITEWRGSVMPITLTNFEERSRPRTVIAICSFNPAAVLRNRKDELVFNMDMGRVRRVMDGRWRKHEVVASINPTFDVARGFIDSLRSAGEPVAYDIETMGGETACIGLANNAHTGMCINFRTEREHRFSLEQEKELRHEISSLLGDRSVRLVTQNGMFDSSWLWYKDRIRVAPHWFDTMLAHHTLYPWMPHNLGFICTQYTTHPYYKNEKTAWREGGDIDRFWRYNVTDCCITWEAARRMQQELETQGLSDFFTQHVMKLQPHLVRMVVGGVKVDLALRERINEELKADLDKLKAAFLSAVHKATGDDSLNPNPLSSAAISDLLFSRLNLVGRGASTKDENRQRMYAHYRTGDAAREVLGALDAYKKEHKFFSTYVDTDLDEDGRMRCEYKQTGVSKAPGRLSSSKVLWGHYDAKSKRVVQHGMNLQNQPARAHAMFIADEGYTFVYADGSQAEARYVGWDAEIETWMEQFEQARLDGKYDAHRALASLMFDVPYDDVPTADEEGGAKTIRFKAKRCRHGLNYRMMADRLATTAGIPLREAENLYRVYHRLHPELRTWWHRLEREARESRYLYNSYGRRLFIQGDLNDKETMESIVAFRPQSTIGDKVSRVIYLCEDDDRWPSDARMALNIHDAVVALCRTTDARLCASIVKKHMQEPIVVRPSLPPLVIPADIAIAEPDQYGIRRWSTLCKVKDIEPAR
jgi:uracil-DNA glycosylase family 4